MKDKIKIKDIPEQYIELVELIGLDTFIKLMNNYNGSYIYIPTIKSFNNQLRNQEIMQMYKNNISIKNIAKKYKLSQNAINKIIKKQ